MQPSLVGHGDNESHNSLQCTNRELHTTILREFQQLTNHFDGCMLRQEELIKSLCQRTARSNDEDTGLWSSEGFAMPEPIHVLNGELLRKGSIAQGRMSSYPMTTQDSYPFAGHDSLSPDPGLDAYQLQAMDGLYGQINLNYEGRQRQHLSGVTASSNRVSGVTIRSSRASGNTGASSIAIGSEATAYTTVTGEDAMRKNQSYSVAARERLKARVSKEQKEHEQSHLRMSNLARHPLFEPVFACAVILNSMLIGIEVEVMAHRDDSKPLVVFQVLTNAFACIFAVELLLRLCAERRSFFCPGSFWNFLDTFLVLFSVLEVVSVVAASSSGRVQSGAGNLRVLRLLRITKIIRVVRVLKVVRFIRALRKLVYAIAGTLKSLLWAMLLLLMITYMFGVVYTQAAIHYMENNDDIDEGVALYWSSLPRSVFTLFKTVTNGISWENSVRPLAHIHWLCVLLFLAYITFMQFAMINVVTGVFCQSAIDSASHDYELVVQGQLANKEMYIDKVTQLFKTMDKDGSGEVTMGEFEHYLGDKKVQAYFSSLELETSDVWTLFKLLDMDESHVLDISEFLLGCLRLRGPAKAIDLAQMAYEHKIFRKRMYKFMANVEKTLGVPGPASSLKASQKLRNGDSRISNGLSNWSPESIILEEPSPTTRSPESPAGWASGV